MEEGSGGKKKTVEWNKWGIAVPQRAANMASTLGETVITAMSHFS